MLRVMSCERHSESGSSVDPESGEYNDDQGDSERQQFLQESAGKQAHCLKDGIFSIAREWSKRRTATASDSPGYNIVLKVSEPDLRFRTYLRAFFADMLTGMSGPLSVPFAALALWASGRTQKILWGCLAVLCAIFASYRVWRNERRDAGAQLEAVTSAKATEVESLRAEKDVEIAALKERITELSRKPYTEELKRITEQVLDYEMTLEGRHVLRHLMIHEPVEVGRVFIPEVPQERQHAQLGIAMQRGLVQHREEGQSLRRTYWVINPRFRPVLEEVLYEDGRL